MTSRIRMDCVVASLLLCLLGSAGFLKAQGSNAVSVSGTVKDPSGAVIPGATVTIYNPVSGFTRHSVHRCQRLVQHPQCPI